MSCCRKKMIFLLCSCSPAKTSGLLDVKKEREREEKGKFDPYNSVCLQKWATCLWHYRQGLIANTNNITHVLPRCLEYTVFSHLCRTVGSRFLIAHHHSSKVPYLFFLHIGTLAACETYAHLGQTCLVSCVFCKVHKLAGFVVPLCILGKLFILWKRQSCNPHSFLWLKKIYIGSKETKLQFQLFLSALFIFLSLSIVYQSRRMKVKYDSPFLQIK